MCVTATVTVAVLVVCLSLSSLAGAQTPLDYLDDGEPMRGSEREIAPAVGETETEVEQERLRLAALQAEIQEELKLARYDTANAEDEGLGAIPGQPGQDYPVYTSVPRTSFTCAGKLAPGYYADVQARCQVFHICDASGAKHSFLCPQGSLFNQKYLVCDWWYTSDCNPPDSQAYQHDFNRIDRDKSPDHYQTEDLPQNEYYGEENYVLPQSDIFYSAETGVPNREKYEARNEKFKKQVVVNNEKSQSVIDGTKGNVTRKSENKLNQMPQLQENNNRDYF